MTAVPAMARVESRGARTAVPARPARPHAHAARTRPEGPGNQARQREWIQAKLTVNQPGDRFEQQADRVADAIMRTPASGAAGGSAALGLPGIPAIQRMCPSCEKEQRAAPAGIQRRCAACENEEPLQAKEAPGHTPEVTPAAARQIDAARSGGQPLAGAERAFFEPRFGRDFGQVRLHTDSRAAESVRAVNARAFTVGHDVVFGSGEYAAGTTAGRQLLAHELTHVLQQEAVTGRVTAPPAAIQRQEPITDITIGAVAAKCILGAIAGVLFDAAIQAIIYAIKERTWRFWRASWDYCSLILSAVISCIAAPISAVTLEPWITARLGPALGGLEGTLLGKILLFLAKKIAIGIPKFIVKHLAKLGCISPEQAAELGVKPDTPDGPPEPPPTPPRPSTVPCTPMPGDVTGDTRVLMKVNTADFLSPEEGVKVDKFSDSVRATGAQIKVHGLASTDGPSDFNDRLSCSRALRGVQLLQERGIPDGRIVGVYRHGEVPGPREWQRAVVYETQGGGGGPTPPGPTPPGPRPPGPTPTPSATLKLRSLRFTSDHGVMKDERKDWGDSGSRFPEPEWQSTSPDGRSAPISHTKGQTIQARVVLDVSAGAAVGTPFDLKGEGPESSLSFEASGALSGDATQEIPVTAQAPLPDQIQAFSQQVIAWSASINNTRQLIGLTTDHEVFATYDIPRKGVTYKRMSTGVALAEGFGNNPHKIVSEQMKRFPSYNLDNPISGNIWVLADDIPAFGGKGADCQSIVRFVGAVNDVIGLPGEARGIAIYASPTAPTTPLEADLVEGGGARGGMWLFHNVGLFDAGDNFNNYEAVLEFTSGSNAVFPDRDRVTRYYPGGVPGGGALNSKRDVLNVFKQMAEATVIAGKARPAKTIWCYAKNAKSC